jgi:hypothetical protein
MLLSSYRGMQTPEAVRWFGNLFKVAEPAFDLKPTDDESYNKLPTVTFQNKL